MQNQKFSDEFLNSFVDNELALIEKNEVFDSISQDENLKKKVCELHGLKGMVKHAYQQALPENMSTPVSKLRFWRPYVQNLAACLLLFLLGGTSGWFIFASTQSKSTLGVMHLLQTMQNNSIVVEPGQIIVHVSSSNPVRLKTALDETENLLESYKRANRQLKVEIIANAEGVNLLRSDVSPYVTRIGLMKAKYPNLDFLACGRTVGLLKEKGVVVRLLPQAGIASSAAEEINKRLLQGWDYVRV